MRREDFDHVVAAAAEISGDPEIVVIGSQAILGAFPDAPDVLLRSLEADVFPHNDPAKADVIDWHLARVAIAAGLVEGVELLARVDDLPIPDAGRQHIGKQLTAIISAAAAA